MVLTQPNVGSKPSLTARYPSVCREYLQDRKDLVMAKEQFSLKSVVSALERRWAL
jgi:hypothetical protein